MPYQGFAYNDGNASTGYDRQFAILLNELWVDFHDGDRDIQESIATDYDPQWFTLNGRVYPQTVLPNDDPSLPAELRIPTPNPNYDDAIDYSQPNSALVQVNPGERALLRLANLGYLQHAMELPGIPMHVVGQDASLLRAGGVDTSYVTNTLYIGPGRGPGRDRRGARVQRRPAVRQRRARGLQRLLLQEPGLAPADELRRAARSRRHDDRAAGVPEPAAAADRREPDLCLSSGGGRR